MSYNEKQANELYGKRRQEMLAKLETLRVQLCEKADADQARSPQSWGHAGSLGHVNEELDNLIKFMS